MLNVELIVTLYDGLPAERQQELKKLLFKNSKHTIGYYFENHQNPSFQTLEILADYFGMPLDIFRKGSQMKTNNVNGNNNYVGNYSFSSNLMKENENLRRENDNLKELIAAKEEIIQAKNEVITSLRFRITQVDGVIKD